MERTRFDINAGCTIDETGLIVSYAYTGTGARCSKGYNTGKKYYEVKATLTSGSANMGLCDANSNLNTTGGPSSLSMYFMVSPDVYRFAAGSSYWFDTPWPTGAYSNPGVWGIAIDFDAHAVKIYYNGALLKDWYYGDVLTQIGTVLYPFVFTGGNNNNATQEFNFGTKPFAYPVPEGYQPWDNVNQRLYLKENEVYGVK